ncbi:MAG: hypothetical protein OXM02_06790 [Bacteroidota bacterium]|nr:hypothetical protein [Bacteroidota bacterium]
MSIGYGFNRRGRPLSPIEVGMLLKRACENGASTAECAKSVRLDASGVARFKRIADLPDDIRHMVDWGGGSDFVGFSAAVEIVRLKGAGDQRAVAEAIMANNLTSKEVRQVTQLRQRSGRSIEACIQEVVQMRPTIIKRYVFIGTVPSDQIEPLSAIPQSARDSILKKGIEKIGIEQASGRLGVQFYTLVGDERFDASMRRIGKETMESLLQGHISQAFVDVSGSD